MNSKHHKFILNTTATERKALSLLKPFNPRLIDPVLYEVSNKATEELYTYFRVAMSSSEQSESDGIGRSMRFLMVDRTSGCFLGLFCIASPNVRIPMIWDMCGWDEHVPMEGRPNTHNAIAYERSRSMLKLTRCIPLFEFGDLLGGKLLTLAAMNRDLLRLFEVKYSLPFVSMFWTTLHGKASQYSRLEASGITLLGEDDYDGRKRGVYWGEFRKNSVKFLKGEIDKPGKILTPSYPEVVSGWKDRWYMPRLDRKDVPEIITPDISKYKLSDKVSLCR